MNAIGPPPAQAWMWILNVAAGVAGAVSAGFIAGVAAAVSAYVVAMLLARRRNGRW
jgi:uncharacterized membrane protein (DUF485 family)